MDETLAKKKTLAFASDLKALPARPERRPKGRRPNGMPGASSRRNGKLLAIKVKECWARHFAGDGGARVVVRNGVANAMGPTLAGVVAMDWPEMAYAGKWRVWP